MKTRIVALFLSLAILLSLCSFAIAEEPTQLTICIGRRPYDSTESYSEKHWVQEVEKACNLKINWIELPEETMKEQLSSVLTNTNNLPDIFMCGNKMTDSIVSQNTGLWHVFTMDEIKQYAPTYYEVCEKYIDGWVDATTYPDGNIYSLMGSVYDSERHYSYGVLYMNYQWLKNLNLEVPTTLDELHDVLVAFRDQDANGNGDPNDEYPININLKYGQGQPLNFAALWGLPITNSIFYKIDENGNVTHAVDTQAFRDFLTYFYQLGQEGLLNLEGLSSTSDQYTAECDAMRSGIFGAWAPSYLITDTANAMQYDGLPKITVPGYEESFCHREFNHANRNAFVISKSCKNVEAALRFYDYISEPTRAIEVFLGEQGIFWDYVDDDYHYEMVYCPSQETDPEGYAAHVQKLIDAGYGDYVEKGIILDGSSLNYYNTVGCVDYGSLVLHAQNYDMTNYADGNVYRIATIRNITERGGYVPAMNTNIVPAEAQEEFDFMCDGLSTVINAFVSESILHGVTDESWNAYLKQLEQYNYDYYIEFFNNKLHNSF